MIEWAELSVVTARINYLKTQLNSWRIVEQQKLLAQELAAAIDQRELLIAQINEKILEQIRASGAN